MKKHILEKIYSFLKFSEKFNFIFLASRTSSFSKFSKAFTLVELVIVLLIISILLWAISFLSWSYLSKLNVQNEKETIEWDFFYNQTLSLSQPNFWKIKNVSYIWIKLSPNKSYIQDVVFTGNLISTHPVYLDTKVFSYLNFWTGVNLYSWENLQKNITNDVFILYKPYTMWAILAENDAGSLTIYTGSYTLKFSFNTIYSTKICYSLSLNSGRLYPVKCEE